MNFVPILILACSGRTESFQFDIHTNVTDHETPTEETESNLEEENNSCGFSDSECIDTAQNDNLDSGVCGDSSTGTNIGDCATNFSLPNQNQESVQLHDYYGQVIFLDLSSFT